MRVLFLCALALACTPEAGAPRPAKSTTASSTAAKAKTPDPAAARALYDSAIKAQLVGDAFAHHEQMLRLAVEHPETRHGRAASRSLGGSGLNIAFVGVLAAIAIPAFTKYINRAKTSEAQMRVRHIADNAGLFFATEGKFPESAPLTPPQSACRFGESVDHAPDPAFWAAPGWKQLGIQVQRPFKYQYEFVSNGTAFTARAYGDLDCDGVRSTFELAGNVDESGAIQRGAGLFIENELE